MKEKYITLDDFVFWLELDHYVGDKPVYILERGYYLGTYAFATHVKYICTKGLTSCVVRHVDPDFVFVDEARALRVLEKLNNDSTRDN